MSGKRIDRAALTLLGAMAFYLFFLRAWDSIPLACLLAFACCALVRLLVRGRPPRRRATAAQVSAELARLACLPDDAAQRELTELIQARYPDETFVLAPVLKHPEAALSPGDVLNAWKANRSAERLVVAATCPCEPRAALYARELRDPAVAVADSRALAGLLRRRGVDAPAAARPVPMKVRLGRLLARVATARVTPKNALLGLALLGLYLALGNPLYLFSALVTLAHFGAALGQHRARKRLFDNP